MRRVSAVATVISSHSSFSTHRLLETDVWALSAPGTASASGVLAANCHVGPTGHSVAANSCSKKAREDTDLPSNNRVS